MKELLDDIQHSMDARMEAKPKIERVFLQCLGKYYKDSGNSLTNPQFVVFLTSTFAQVVGGLFQKYEKLFGVPIDQSRQTFNLMLETAIETQLISPDEASLELIKEVLKNNN